MIILCFILNYLFGPTFSHSPPIVLGIVMEMGIVGAWLGFAAWIIPLALVMTIKVSRGTWKQIEV